MKHMMVGVVVGLALGSGGVARADEKDDAANVLLNSVMKAWESNGRLAYAGQPDTDGNVECIYKGQLATKRGVPDTLVVKVDRDIPGLKEGDRTVAEVRAACTHLQLTYKMEDFQKWGVLAMSNAQAIADGYIPKSDYYEHCQTRYAEYLKAGGKATDPVKKKEIESKTDFFTWDGTAEAMKKKWCDVGGGATGSAEDAPYEKALKGQKLRLALQHRSIILPGGKKTSDPKVMAKANVWYIDTQPGKTCEKNKQVHVVERWVFTSAGDLDTSGSSHICGAPTKKDLK